MEREAMSTISVFIITFNEEGKIERCLKSLDWVDEIVIVDSFSNDKTVAICNRYTDKIYKKQFIDYTDQKNFALSKTSCDWVLSIDADEEVTSELKKELLSLLSKDSVCPAYRIRRKSRIFGRWLKFSGTQHDAPIRLWRKGRAHFYQPIHEKVTVEGAVGRLKNFLRHYTYESLSEYMTRLNRYTTMEAGWFITSKKRMEKSVAIRSLSMFIKRYIVDLGILDAMPGFLFSVLSAYYTFVKHAKYQAKDLQ